MHDFTLSERAWLDKEKPTRFEREVWYAAYHDLESAYDEAYGELEDVCTSSPYHALSEKYRCACGKSVVYCECMTKCECMVPRDSDDGGDCGGWVEKWSWRLIDDGLECSALYALAMSRANCRMSSRMSISSAIFSLSLRVAFGWWKIFERISFSFFILSYFIQ